MRLVIPMNPGPEQVSSQMSWKRIEEVLRATGNLKNNETVVNFEATKDGLKFHLKKWDLSKVGG